MPDENAVGDVQPEGASGPSLGKPALITSFYMRRGSSAPLQNELIGRLALHEDRPRFWVDDRLKTFLMRIDPAAAHDSTVLQLILNPLEDAPIREKAIPVAWNALRERLAKSLEGLRGCVGAALDRVNFWGCTLTYQADLAEGAELSDALLTEELLSAAVPLEPLQATIPEPLAADTLSSGKLWLLRVPLFGDGLEAVTVYMALAIAGSKMITDMLLGPRATLLMPDLIAHKGYHQMREYKTGKSQKDYERLLTRLFNQTERVLLQGGDIKELDGMGSSYLKVLGAVSELSRLGSSLEKQNSNYALWEAKSVDENIFVYHRGHLRTAQQELSLMVSEGDRTLNAAGTTIEMVQAKLDKQRSKRLQRIEVGLAVVAVALAVPALLDRTIVCDLLKLGAFVTKDEPVSELALFGVQAAITALLAILVGGVVAWWLGTKEKKL